MIIATTKERLMQFLDIKGIDRTQFYFNTGIKRGLLDADKLKSTITDIYLAKIIATYPCVNIEWLLDGKGEMLKSEDSFLYKDEQNKELAAMIADRGIPLIPLDAFAGFGMGNSTQVMEYECEHYVVPSFAGAEFLIQVKGSSMYPKYSSGDIVACKKLPLDTFFQWNKVYVVDSEQGVLIKRIKRGRSDDHILLVSENAQYDSFELHKKEIQSLAIVVGVIRLE